MAHFAPLLGVTLLWGFLGLLAADYCDLHAAPGQSLALPFAFHGLNRQHVVRWTHDNKIVFYRQGGRVSMGKEADVAANGSLLLSDLKASAAGFYRVNVLHPNATPADSWSGRLCVEERVPKPRLDYACDYRSAVVNLDCLLLVADPGGLDFQWALDGKRLESQSGQRLSVSLAKLRGQGSFTCSAANKVSKAESDAVRPVCKTPPPPPPPPPPVLLCYRTITVKAVLAGGACLILLLLTVVIVQCCSSGKRGRGRLREKQELGMVAISQREPGSVGPEYESMRCVVPSTEPSARTSSERVPHPDSGNSPPLLSATAEVKQPSPVPKPRTKTALPPNTHGNN